MNLQEELSVTYRGQPTKIGVHTNGLNSFFTIHLPGETIELRVEYIDGNPCWTENGLATERAGELGRLIEEFDGR